MANNALETLPVITDRPVTIIGVDGGGGSSSSGTTSSPILT